MAYDIGPKIGIDGEQQFRKEIRDINAQMRALASEAKAVQSAYQGQEDSAESLEKQNEILNKQINAQRQAIEKLNAMLDKSREKYGENDETTQKWQDTVNRATLKLKNLEKQLDQVKTRLDIVSESFQKSGQQLNQIGNTLTAGLTGPLVAAGAASVKYASDTEESLNKVDVAFGTSESIISDWSDTTLTSIGLAKGTALDMAALYGDMATSMGYSKKEAADMSKTLVNLSADLASFKNLSINEANTALKSIFTGETESLKNLGVVMTETNLEAYALQQGLEKTYSQMSQNEKISLRYQYVLAMTANAQGDFARTFDSTANQSRVLQESLKEAAATLGQDLLPVVTPLIQNLAKMVQSFSSLDAETRKSIVQLGLFLAILGPMLKLTGGISTAASKLINMYKSLKAAAAAAAAGQGLLNAAMSANVIGAVITAVASLVAVLGSLYAASSLTAGMQNEHNEALEEAKKTHEEAAKSIEDESAKTMAMVDSLEQLVAVEQKTNAQKQEILNLVNELNEAIPNLALAYDAETNSLNMTAEAIRNLAEAEAMRQIQQENYDQIVEQTRIRIQADKDLAAAESELSLVETQLASATDEANRIMANGGTISSELSDEIDRLSTRQSELVETTNSMRQASDAAQTSIDYLQQEIDQYSESADNSTQSTQNLSEITSELNDREQTLRSSTSSLTSEVDTLKKALDEQANSGTVSLETALKLIDAGYAAALAIDNETGAITLNKDTYIQLTKAKIEEQIAALERQKISEQNEIQNLREAYSAAALANSYLEMAKAEAASAGRVQSFDAQIAALKNLENNLGNYTVSVKRASVSTSKATKTVETAAEKELKAYQDSRKEIDHLLAMGEITEAEYYARLAKLRDQYLTDTENIDEYRKVNEEIYKYDQELAEKEVELWTEQTEKLTDEIQNRFDEIISARDEMAKTLSDYGDLFTEEDGQYALESLTEQTKMLDQYSKMLDDLASRGVPDDLMSEIIGMDIEDAIGYMDQLVKLSDDDWNAYVAAWNEKQQTAIEIAQKFYQDELELLETEYNTKLDDALDSLEDTAFSSGMDTAQGLADGIKNNAQAAIDEARWLARQVEMALNSELDINSPSGVTEKTGRYTAQGFEVGFVDEMQDIRGRMIQSASPADTANQAISGMVNGMAGVMAQNTGGVYEINLKVGDSVLASAIFDPLRKVIKQKGEQL